MTEVDAALAHLKLTSELVIDAIGEIAKLLEAGRGDEHPEELTTAQSRELAEILEPIAIAAGIILVRDLERHARRQGAAGDADAGWRILGRGRDA